MFKWLVGFLLLSSYAKAELPYQVTDPATMHDLEYLDANDGAAVKKTGSTMSGPLTLVNSNIILSSNTAATQQPAVCFADGTCQQSAGTGVMAISANAQQFTGNGLVDTPLTLNASSVTLMGLLSSIAQITNHSHTVLTDIGTRSHTQLESDIALKVAKTGDIMTGQLTLNNSSFTILGGTATFINHGQEYANFGGGYINNLDLTPNPVKYATRLYPFPLDAAANESAAQYIRINPIGISNQQIGIYGEITENQEDTEAALMKIVHNGNGDAIYVALSSQAAIGLETASFHNGTRGIISTLQIPDADYTTLFTGLWQQDTVPLYGGLYMDSFPGNAITIRKTASAVDSQSTFRVWSNDLGTEVMSVKNNGDIYANKLYGNGLNLTNVSVDLSTITTALNNKVDTTGDIMGGDLIVLSSITANRLVSDYIDSKNSFLSFNSLIGGSFSTNDGELIRIGANDSGVNTDILIKHKLAIQRTAPYTPSEALDVSGNAIFSSSVTANYVIANYLVGDGSGITGLTYPGLAALASTQTFTGTNYFSNPITANSSTTILGHSPSLRFYPNNNESSEVIFGGIDAGSSYRWDMTSLGNIGNPNYSLVFIGTAPVYNRVLMLSQNGHVGINQGLTNDSGPYVFNVNGDGYFSSSMTIGGNYYGTGIYADTNDYSGVIYLNTGQLTSTRHIGLTSNSLEYSCTGAGCGGTTGLILDSIDEITFKPNNIIQGTFSQDGSLVLNSSFTASYIYGDGSHLTGLSGSGDNLGSHIATMTITGNYGASISTLVVTGSSFSVGGSTLVVAGGQVTAGNGFSTESGTKYGDPSANIGVSSTGRKLSLYDGAADKASIGFGTSGIWVQNLSVSNPNIFQVWGNGADVTTTEARVTVKQTGKVGINTTTPGSTLHVNGDGHFGGPLTIASSVTATGALLSYGNVTNGYGAVIANIANTSTAHGLYVSNAYNTSDTFVMRVQSNTTTPLTPNLTDLFAIKGNGNVGIGTIAPGAKLEVNGNIVSSGTINAQNGLCINNDCKTVWGSGTGDAVLASTQTFTGTNSFTSLSTMTISGTVDIGWETIYSQVTTTGLTISCSAGKTIMGGGCSAAGANTVLVASYPASNRAWYCGTNQNYPLSGWAICARILPH